ncbi:MAG: DUF952 domain-containing protein [Chloroflexota bacterium]|nr:DUF952 domain-containing protein [Chloroflexota bacterium]
MDARILHIVTFEEYVEIAALDSYRAPSLDTEGFIHFSTPAQVAGVANRFYSDRGELLLLVVDPRLLTAPLIYEAPSGSGTAPAPGLFPHLYGALDMNAVVAVISYPPGADGRYAAPEITTGE